VDSERLGWGVIGLGRIASTQIAPGIVASANSSLISVVSRDQGRAEKFAQKHGAAHAFDDYAKMLADPAVEAVYIATPECPARRACDSGGQGGQARPTAGVAPMTNRTAPH
jgi:predicted dehydrogenase